MMKHLLVFLFAAASLMAKPPGPGGASGDGIWVRNAAFGEIETFDLCNGHQPGSGQYHHHVNPVCLRAQLGDNVVTVINSRLGTQYAEKAAPWTHSPILGWAFDGYPVYGPYGYSNPNDAKSAVRRLKSGFQLRNITQRHTLPAWVLPYHPTAAQTLNANQYGPDVNAVYPLGRYVEDYDFAAGTGDLDQYNGRFSVTPEYPNGTYAYFVTIAEDGSPAFPYIINVQLYGTSNGGNSPNVATDAVDYFSGGALQQAASTDPQLASWYIKGSKQNAMAITAYDPSAGPSPTWPTNKPADVNISGGNATAALADIQRVRYNGANVYVNSNNLPSYVIGPWFAAEMTGGVFMNFAAAVAQQFRVTRAPASAAAKSSSGLGPTGVWVNGVSIFNTLDGGSYSNSAGADVGGGGIAPHATHLSAASFERGPVAPGSLVSAFPEFNAALATSVATGTPETTEWPLTLGGATVTVTDSTGAALPAGIVYASPTQLNYRIPPTAAPGFARVAITAAGTTVIGNVTIAAAYPGIFRQTADGLAAGQILRVHNGAQTYESLTANGVALGSDQVYLILYGTGLGTANVTATIGGAAAAVAYAGPQGTYPGLDQINLLIPASLAAKGPVNAIVTAGGRTSNPVYLVLQ
jgi:uncharacterized protein (TIGR03437 family)